MPCQFMGKFVIFGIRLVHFQKINMTQIGNVQLVHILAVCVNFLLWYLYFGTKPINGQNFSYNILAPNQLLFLPIFWQTNLAC
jgi:hypothetical protein